MEKTEEMGSVRENLIITIKAENMKNKNSKELLQINEIPKH